MDGKGVIVLAVIAIILAMGIVYMFPLSCKKSCTEGFDTPVQSSCPSGSKSFYDDHGNLLCCSGQVNGTKCEGSVVCTFSGNATHKYPLCNKQRKRKYMGPINPFVQQVMSVDFVSKFAQVLKALVGFSDTLKTLPEGQVSVDDAKKYNALIVEENAWYRDNRESDSQAYQEECMYIIQTLTGIFSGKPIMNNQALIQKQVMKQVCAQNA